MAMCSAVAYTYVYVSVPCLGLFLLCVLFVFYKYTQTKKDDLPKLLYLCNVSFYVFLILSCMAQPALSINILNTDCEFLKTSNLMLWGINIVCYSGQYTFLLLVLFYRLYYIFRGTVFKLSKCTIAFFFTCGFTSGITMTIGVYDGFVTHSTGRLGWIMTGISYVFFIIVNIFTSLMFILKLRTLFKQNQRFGMLATMTRCTVLATISISSTVILFVINIVFGFIWNYKNLTANIVFGSFICLDSFTNFLCITLAQKFARQLYDTLCGSVDTLCNVCCNNMYVTEQPIASRTRPSITQTGKEITDTSHISGRTSQIDTQKISHLSSPSGQTTPINSGAIP
eukprot:227086_1